MAKIKAKKRTPVRLRADQVYESVTVELTIPEVAAILAAYNHIGGDPQLSARGPFNRVVQTIQDETGIRIPDKVGATQGVVVNDGTCPGGCIYFETKASEKEVDAALSLMLELV
jgi:hypothetical protein